MNKWLINYLFGIDIIIQWEHEVGDQCEQGVEHPINFCSNCGAKMEVTK